MKLLFDENLSPRLVDLFTTEFPGSTHIEHLGMRGVSDAVLWAHARDHGYIIVSKDNDFRQYAFLHAPPPKVVWLSVGNAGTVAIAKLIRDSVNILRTFEGDPEQSLLVLEIR